MSQQKIPVNDFTWVEEKSKFNEGSIKIYNGHSVVG